MGASGFFYSPQRGHIAMETGNDAGESKHPGAGAIAFGRIGMDGYATPAGVRVFFWRLVFYRYATSTRWSFLYQYCVYIGIYPLQGDALSRYADKKCKAPGKPNCDRIRLFRKLEIALQVSSSSQSGSRRVEKEKPPAGANSDKKGGDARENRHPWVDAILLTRKLEVPTGASSSLR